MKKILFLALMLMFIASNCFAYDYYVGNYKGAEKYLMTETIQKVEENYGNEKIIDFYFKVKAVYKNSVKIDDYHCDFPSGIGFFEVNGVRVGSRVGDNEHTIIERNIIDYLVKNF